MLTGRKGTQTTRHHSDDPSAQYYLAEGDQEENTRSKFLVKDKGVNSYV